MNVIIKETGTLETIFMIDPKTGTDYVRDFLGNNYTDAEYNDDGELTMSQSDFDWWYALCMDYHNAECAKHELIEKLTETLDDADLHEAKEALTYDDRYNCDLEDLPGAVMMVVEDVRGRYLKQEA